MVESVQVRLRLWGVFQELVGERELEVNLPERAKVRDLLNELVKRHGSKFEEALFEPGSREIRPYVKLLLNGHGTGPKAKLSEGDVVAIFPPVGGG